MNPPLPITTSLPRSRRAHGALSATLALFLGGAAAIGMAQEATPAPPATKAPAAEPAARLQELIRLGREFRERGDTNTALIRFREAATVDPTNAEAVFETALTYEKMGFADKAAEQWRRLYDMGKGAGAWFKIAEEKLNAAKAAAESAAAGPPGPGRYQASEDFEKYARMLREKSLLKLEPQVKIPTTSRPPSRSRYPWRHNIVATLIWIGSEGKKSASAWDPDWLANFGGADVPEPRQRRGFIPAGFIPKQNPFYCALPYNDVKRGATKPEARAAIPWFNEAFEKEGQSVCRDRWVRIRNRAGKNCYAQWSDCGPFGADHWQYVFGDERPKANRHQGAGISLAPAVRDYLGLSDTDVVDWQFVDVKDAPRGPWSMYGENNHFVQMARRTPSKSMKLGPLKPAEPTLTPNPTVNPQAPSPEVPEKAGAAK